MELVRLTEENVFQYIGFEILFKTRGHHIVKTIINASESGKSITIDHPDLNNTLEIVSRNVYVIIP
jgi:hypothetical protein